MFIQNTAILAGVKILPSVLVNSKYINLTNSKELYWEISTIFNV